MRSETRTWGSIDELLSQVPRPCNSTSQQGATSEYSMQQLSNHARTVAILVLLVPRLAVPEPVQRVLLRVRALVLVVLPARMLQRLDGVQIRACIRRKNASTRHIQVGYEPGHKPMILPSSLPSLYHERQFALYTDCKEISKDTPSARNPLARTCGK